MAEQSVITGDVQYLRKCTLVVSGRDLTGLDLSNLRIKFAVKRSETQTPNTADIRVYNLSLQDAVRVRDEFKQVVLEAGYESNYGVIFKGNITQVIIGRESGTDTFIDIIAGDGDKAYNFSIVRETIAAGASQTDQVRSAIKAMNKNGVTQGHIPELGGVKLPRGKVMFGNAKNYLSNSAETTENYWSIQDEKVTFVGKKAYLPGEAVVITAATGMVGSPQQTNDGVNVKTLLNPKIVTMGRVQLDNDTIQQQKLNLEQIAAQGGDNKKIGELLPRALNTDGIYYVAILEHIGDTRGTEWYSNLICINNDSTANPRNSVQGGGSAG
jgi:hypothetical protein